MKNGQLENGQSCDIDIAEVCNCAKSTSWYAQINDGCKCKMCGNIIEYKP